MKNKTRATACLRYGRSFTARATSVYKDRSAMMAKMLLVYTMKGSCETPRTAGIESTANTKSEISMQTRHRSSGVATLAPPCSVKNFSPS
eukprot:scaffold294_cov281-Pinguiococcus_pyrenoidosus.AAC.7